MTTAWEVKSHEGGHPIFDEYPEIKKIDVDMLHGQALDLTVWFHNSPHPWATTEFVVGSHIRKMLEEFLLDRQLTTD